MVRISFSVFLVSVFLSSCVLDNLKHEDYAAVPEVEPRHEQDISSLVEDAEKVSGEVIDRPAFIRNYLAAQMSEYAGKRNDAAIYYAHAGMAFPSYKPLQEKAFAMQLLAGNWENVIEISRYIVTADDPLPLTTIVLAIEEIRLENYAEAQRYMERAIQQSPSIVHLKLIQAYIRLAQGEDATIVAGDLRELPYSPLMSAIKHYHLGHIFMMAGDYEEAELEFSIAYEQDNASLFAVKGLIHVLNHTKQMDKITQLLDRFYEQNPDNIMLLTTAKKYREGDAEPVEKLTIHQAISDVLFNFATLLASQNATLSGHQILNMATVLDEENPYIDFYKGVLYEQEGAEEQAFAVYQRMSEKSDVYSAAQVRLSGALQRAGKFDEAAKIIKKLHDEYHTPIFRRILAEMYYTAGDYAKAVKAYSRILEKGDVESSEKDTMARVYFARGSAYERLMQYEKATADLQKSITIRPEDPNTLNYLGYMLVDLEKDVQRGMSLISKALLLKPNDAAILDSMGWAWYKSGEFEKALTFLQRAIKNSPQDPTINMHMGETYKELGEIEMAKDYLQRALELGPDTKRDSQNIKEKLSKLHKMLQK